MGGHVKGGGGRKVGVRAMVGRGVGRAGGLGCSLRRCVVFSARLSSSMLVFGGVGFFGMDKSCRRCGERDILMRVCYVTALAYAHLVPPLFRGNLLQILWMALWRREVAEIGRESLNFVRGWFRGVLGSHQRMGTP